MWEGKKLRKHGVGALNITRLQRFSPIILAGQCSDQFLGE